ncbi:hypothetical protein IQ238_02335 [Pleurocapsales cyanobacterium LEGE 06147]|nr:hypothetical protein [Pleurocapsales cyanobacterium LEGE 06147]
MLRPYLNWQFLLLQQWLIRKRLLAIAIRNILIDINSQKSYNQKNFNGT